jgi:hypothetical protein
MVGNGDSLPEMDIAISATALKAFQVSRAGKSGCSVSACVCASTISHSQTALKLNRKQLIN